MSFLIGKAGSTSTPLPASEEVAVVPSGLQVGNAPVLEPQKIRIPPHLTFGIFPGAVNFQLAGESHRLPAVVVLVHDRAQGRIGGVFPTIVLGLVHRRAMRRYCLAD